jgi:hypothetical protein
MCYSIQLLLLMDKLLLCNEKEKKEKKFRVIKIEDDKVKPK